jgi:hypothetical protein
MAILSEMEQNAAPRYQGGATAPIGSYVCVRTLAYYQNTSDGALPAGDWWFRVTTSGTSTASQIATALNGLISGAAYTSSNLHSYSSGTDAPQVAGTGANDA